MTELKKPTPFTVFVGGPIQYALAGESFDPELKRRLVSVLDVAASAADRLLSAHLAEGFGEKTPELDSDHITSRDFAWMQQCNVYVAVLPMNSAGVPYRTDGTYMEVGWASAMRKPTILLTEGTPPNDSYSHLVRGLSAVTFVATLDLREVLFDPGALRAVLLELRRREAQGECREAVDDTAVSLYDERDKVF